ncbi:MAG: response regulator [Anaerolineales bacterium]|nr:response regulator [Anaerolineales bacterium]
MPEATRILIVEDLPTDAELAQREIKGVLAASIFQRVDTYEAYLAALEEFQPDLIVSDYSMPSFDGLTALKLALAHVPLTPVIILTGSINEDTAVECMKAGAADYVLKEYHKRLGQAVMHALAQKKVRQERQRAEESLRESEERLRLTLMAANQGLYDLNLQTGEAQVSPEYATMLGYDPAEFHETTPVGSSDCTRKIESGLARPTALISAERFRYIRSRLASAPGRVIGNGFCQWAKLSPGTKTDSRCGCSAPTPISMNASKWNRPCT